MAAQTEADKFDVLVDTSVFVDFLRAKHPRNEALRHLIDERRVLLSRYVRLELLNGVRRSEARTLCELLAGFTAVPFAVQLFESAEILLPLARKGGLTFGLVDYLIVLEALAQQAALYTRDQTMRRLARNLGVSELSA